MAKKSYFSMFFEYFRRFFMYFWVKTKIFWNFVNPYRKLEQEAHTIKKSRLFYNSSLQWAIKIFFNAFFLWLSFLLMFSKPFLNNPFKFCLGAILLLWLVGGMAKSTYDYYVGGRIKWVRELPSQRR